MSTLVVDASVALKWVIEEEGSDAAADLAGQPLIAPDLLWIECANALWVKARRGELEPTEAVDRLTTLAEAPVERAASEPLLGAALDLALRLDRTVYDCLYLALARDREATLVTFDRRFAERVAGEAGLAEAVRLLGSA